MENKIQIFNNEEFGEVRTLNEDGKIYFVASDIAKRLGYMKPANAISAHCRYTLKRSIPHPQGKGTLDVNVIPESDVYRLITHSKLPTAERFEKWVFDEVLPSIRKTGSYSLEIPKDYPSALRALADQCELNRLMKPKADFYDTVASTESLLSMNDTAKILNMGIGRNRLFKFLRDKNVLMKDNMPYQRYVDAGYFKVVESYYMAGDNSVVSKTTYVRQRGVDYIRKLLKECA